MKLPLFAEKFIIRTIGSRMGPALSQLIALAAGTGTAFLASKVPGIDSIITEAIIGGTIFFFFNWGVQLLPDDIKRDYGKAIQNSLNEAGAALRKDGYVGPVTVQAVKDKLSR